MIQYNTHWKRTRVAVFFLALLIFIVGCRNANNEDTQTPDPLPTLSTTPLPTTFPEPTLVGIESMPTTEAAATQPATVNPNPTASQVPTSTPKLGDVTAVSYQVAFVEPNDTLNVRSGAGVDNAIVGTLAHNATDIQITGGGSLISGSTWMPITVKGVQGWVNGRFLTTTISNEAFCGDAEAVALLSGLETAVSTQNDAAFAQLIHPERGLRVRRHWWNPELLFKGNEAANLFNSSTSHEWGVADGTGNPIVGSFSNVILPLLQDHLQNGTQTACNDILQGGTAGWIKLPDAYPQQFYSTYFAGTDEFDGLDWGSWVVGIEQWQGRYYISYLVHFEWEI